MAAVEEACTKLPPWEVDELRSDCSHLLRNHQPPSKVNITQGEYRAIKELREDQSRVVLRFDKEMTMVVIDKEEYKDKALSLLSDTNTYRTINKDSITKLRNQLINTLKGIKQAGGLNDSIYKKVYPTIAVPPCVMASSKSTGLAPPQPNCVQQGFHYLWCGQCPGRYHLPLGRSIPTPSKSTQHFVEHIKQVKLKLGETITSLDVKVFFSSVQAGSFHSYSAA